MRCFVLATLENRLCARASIFAEIQAPLKKLHRGTVGKYSLLSLSSLLNSGTCPCLHKCHRLCNIKNTGSNSDNDVYVHSEWPFLSTPTEKGGRRV